MPSTNLSFAKIVATPTSTSWSQAYNAGSLFIVVSLTSDDEVLQEQLPTQGKQLLDNIQAEFFGLEEKTFETIKKAIEQALGDLDETIELSVSLTFCKEDALYAFIVGTGRITLKRSDKIGVILEELSSTTRDINSSSGYLQSDDLILIQTGAFARTVPTKIILEALDNTIPNDIAETITPSVHGGDEGGASAIILSYKGVSRTIDEETEQVEELPHTPSYTPVETTTSRSFPINQPPDLSQDLPEKARATHTIADEDIAEESEQLPFITKLREKLSSIPTTRLPKQKKVTLGVICLLFGLLIISIFIIQQRNQSNKNHTFFVKIYDSAKKDYDEGEGLLSLNKSLALDDYTAAKTTLDTAKGKFEVGSSEEKQLSELASNVEKRLAELSGSSNPSVSEVNSSVSPVLKALLDTPSLLGATEEEGTVYTLSTKSIAQEGKNLVTNADTWNKARSLGTFSGNFYVLDSQKGLVKIVPAGGDYVTSSYFKEDEPDLKNAVSMTIDSSIYILFADGAIQKYTRGTKDTFDTTTVTKSFSSPKAIYTSSEIKNVYVLDTGNSRLVKLEKNGTFIAEYSASVAKTATAFSISNDEKSAYLLSTNKIYKLSL